MHGTPPIALPQPTVPAAALFDADGTLWHGDLSEDFARWLIAHNRLESSWWERYHELNQRDLVAAAIFMCEFYAGVAAHKLDLWIDEFWRTAPPRPWIDPVRDCVTWAKSHSLSTYVVSGSPTPLFAPIHQFLPLDGVIAMDLEVDSHGVFTGKPLGTPCVDRGKPVRVRQQIELPVFLAVGNSPPDIPMLQMSQHAWVINPNERLRNEAQKNRWVISDYRLEI